MVRDSVGGGRSFAQVERYSAELAEFMLRDVRHGIESYAFLGWLKEPDVGQARRPELPPQEES